MEQTILFAEDVYDKIFLGKRCTIRKGRRDMALGITIFKSTDKERTMRGYITRVMYCQAQMIPTHYLSNDGYSSVKEMCKDMKKYYDTFDKTTECTVIEFFPWFSRPKP